MQIGNDQCLYWKREIRKIFNMTKTSGSQFYSIDFHVHTPASNDYKDKDALASDIIQKAIDAKLDAIVVTDHNTFAWVEKIREAARDTSITVFPGFEINSNGGHVLGVFDPSAKIDDVETALIRCGIDKKDFGTEAALGYPIEKVFSVIADNGGIAIAAHVDKEKGFLRTIDQGVATIQIYKSPSLSAIEISDIALKDEHTKGKFKGIGRTMPCVQGSDAHSLTEIGKQRTLVKTHHLSLEGLRQAFGEPFHRIKFPNEVMEVKYPYIVKIMVNQGFLAKQEIFFNRGFNCIVGGAGSGKSTIIEFIRFALDQISPIKEIADDCEAKVRELAQLEAKIYVLVKTETDEQFLVCRTYDGLSNPISVFKYPTKEHVKDIDIKNLFRVHAYSQGEAISIARNPLAQLDLIDNHLTLTGYKREIENAYTALRNQQVINVLQGKVDNKAAIEKEKSTNEIKIKALKRELDSLEEAKKNPIITSHSLWGEENEFFQQMRSSIVLSKKEIVEDIDRIQFSVSSIQKPSTSSPNIDRINKLSALLELLEESKGQVKKVFLDKLGAIETAFREMFTEWNILFDLHNEQYKEFEESTHFGNIRDLNIKISELNANNKKCNAELTNIKSAEEQLDKELQKRKGYIEKIRDQKSRIRTLREKKVREFTARLEGSVKIRLIPDGNTNNYESFTSTVMKGRYMSKEIVRSLCKSIHPWDLANYLRARDYEKISDLSSLDQKWSKALIEVFNGSPENLIKLEAVELEDLLEIEYKVNDGQYKPLEKLSTGQKATVVVLLSMIEGKYPIVFDQPEDALYTPFIYTDVVKTLKAEKETRQFIFATHNSNLAIGGDTDYGIVLDSTADQTEIAESGGLDDYGTRNAMLLVLEGGEEALRVRIGKFGLNEKRN
jgi:ABC-type lipoprotein export system ATPase subunit